MLRNYLTIALRNLWKRRFFTTINIAGLAIGMAACLLISLYVLDELSYDRFHQRAEDIYRITTHLDINGQVYDVAATSADIGEVLTTALPEAEQVVRLNPLPVTAVRHEEKILYEENILAADSNFFEVFSFSLIEGNSRKCLQQPKSIVLTETTAIKYFGQSSDILGNTLTLDGESYTVTGLVQDPPSNSHFHFDFLIPYEYEPYNSWAGVDELKTYLLLSPKADPGIIPDKLFALFKEFDTDQYEELQDAAVGIRFDVQPMVNIHLHSELLNEFEPSGDINYVYIFASIAIFIMLLACTNFINLSTARSAERAREVGVRKVVGSNQSMLIRQFLIESLVISILAMVLGLGLAEILRYPFNEIASKNLQLDLLNNPAVWLVIMAITLTSGLLAGIYPAWYLTRFDPVTVLKGNFLSGRRSQKFRNSLVIFQYSVSICLVICTLLVYQQLRFMRDINLGFDKENVLLIQNTKHLGQNQAAFINMLRNQSDIASVAASTQSPLTPDNTSDARKKGTPPTESIMLANQIISYEYLETMNIQLKQGRNFSREYASDTAALILNQAAVDALGLEDPIDAIIDYDSEYDYHVIGVTQDFHIDSPHHPIEPFAFILNPSDQPLDVILVKVPAGNPASLVENLETQWNTYTSEAPFSYSFLDEDYDALFRFEQRLGKLFTGFALLAILIAGLGLFALVAFMAERRSKEIGIRKVLGATVVQVVLLLSREFIWLLAVAILIAVPLGYFSMKEWLSNFAYHTDLQASVFIIAGGAVMVVAWLTISFQSIKAARANPVESLKNE